ncbi:hypothetical protein [Actinomyces procaprae]|uniref:hypothetical protein n=1 Tax=Actinomyces procaprae TaxID=2560010 RepID=UPI00109E35C6|nr:hypothetical protein [Actinomyces procaprae]
MTYTILTVMAIWAAFRLSIGDTQYLIWIILASLGLISLFIWGSQLIALGTPRATNRFDLHPGQLFPVENVSQSSSPFIQVRPIASVRHYQTPNDTTVEVALAGSPELLSFEQEDKPFIISAEGWSRARNQTTTTDDRLLTANEETDLRLFVQAVARESYDVVTGSENWTSPIRQTHISRMATNLGYITADGTSTTASFRVNQTGLSFLWASQPEWSQAMPDISVSDNGTIRLVANNQVSSTRLPDQHELELLASAIPELSQQLEEIIRLQRETNEKLQPKSALSRLATLIASIGIDSISSAGGAGIVQLVTLLVSR